MNPITYDRRTNTGEGFVWAIRPAHPRKENERACRSDTILRRHFQPKPETPRAKTRPHRNKRPLSAPKPSKRQNTKTRNNHSSQIFLVEH